MTAIVVYWRWRKLFLFTIFAVFPRPSIAIFMKHPQSTNKEHGPGQVFICDVSAKGQNCSDKCCCASNCCTKKHCDKLHHHQISTKRPKLNIADNGKANQKKSIADLLNMPSNALARLERIFGIGEVPSPVMQTHYFATQNLVPNQYGQQYFLAHRPITPQPVTTWFQYQQMQPQQQSQSFPNQNWNYYQNGFSNSNTQTPMQIQQSYNIPIPNNVNNHNQLKPQTYSINSPYEQQQAPPYTAQQVPQQQAISWGGTNNNFNNDANDQQATENKESNSWTWSFPDINGGMRPSTQTQQPSNIGYTDGTISPITSQNQQSRTALSDFYQKQLEQQQQQQPHQQLTNDGRQGSGQQVYRGVRALSLRSSNDRSRNLHKRWFYTWQTPDGCVGCASGCCCGDYCCTCTTYPATNTLPTTWGATVPVWGGTYPTWGTGYTAQQGTWGAYPIQGWGTGYSGAGGWGTGATVPAWGTTPYVGNTYYPAGTGNYLGTGYYQGYNQPWQKKADKSSV